MPARPRSREIGLVEQRLIDSFRRAAQDPIPHNPLLLRAIIETLVSSLGRHNPKWARTVRATIHNLSAHEIFDIGYNNPFDLHTKSSSYRELLKILAAGKADKWNHFPHIIQLQRDLLVRFLKENPFPGKSGNSIDRTRWIQQHGEAIMSQISFLPCVCTYRTDFKRKKLYDHIETNKNDLPLIIILLSWLHGMKFPLTAEDLYNGQMRKYLKRRLTY